MSEDFYIGMAVLFAALMVVEFTNSEGEVWIN